ncbi:MAG: DUF4215 domain-containing protein [Polyangiales bacterium]
MHPAVRFRPLGQLATLSFLALALTLGACDCDSKNGGGDGGPGDGGSDAGSDGMVPDGNVTDPCGNAVRGSAEACDDGNMVGGDGCSADCKMVELGWKCPLGGGACVPTVCGNKLIEPPTENCDDGNANGSDGCSSTCQLESGWSCPIIGAACSAARCGDGLLAGLEECDDGDTVDTNGCSNQCRLNSGYKCPTPGQPCVAIRCGDGLVEGTEQCDNDVSAVGALPRSFDGCSSTCQNEPSGCSGGTCTPICGDGIILDLPGQEACDDGNKRNGDGCSSTCQVESGFSCTLVPEPLPAQLRLPLTLRDFKGIEWYTAANGGHPDFNDPSDSNDTIRFGLVSDTLTAGRPTLSGSGSGAAVGDTTNGDPKTVAGFNQWYTDNATVNRVVVRELVLTLSGNTYTYDSAGTVQNPTGFFPIDSAGWTSTSEPMASREAPRTADMATNGGGSHNFNFTTETHFWFQYGGNEVLTFSGDDDLWVFIDGHRCLDVGGLHPRRVATMNLGNPNASSADGPDGPTTTAATTAERAVVQSCKAHLDSLVTAANPRPLVEMVIFHAERHTSASNFKLTLTGFVKQRSSCASTCGDAIVTRFEACDLGTAMNTGGYNGCNANCTLGPYCGDMIVQQPQETCDDGTNLGGYNQCAPGCNNMVGCGNGILEGSEQCDAGANNGKPGSGCTATCTIEIG